jgi:adenylosuccinate lyase
VDSHLIDSEVFGHLWGTDETRALFSDRGRLARWLQVLGALAEAQAACGVIPAASAQAIVALDPAELPISEIAARTRDTAHSTLGLIQVLREHLPAEAAEHVYYGTTVQDITDTALALEMRAVGGLLWRDLWQIEADLLALAEAHRDTPMAGRTHGQPGAPISFGLKVASWADEVGRHLERLRQGRSRWLVGQLGGAVGSLAFFGVEGPRVRAGLCDRLGLGDPGISWLTTRDRLAELAHVVAMATTTLARVANEVYVLQRWELRELAEPTTASTVGSITMPHKRNPEASEQIVTLARLVRAQSGVLLESMVQEHERDARGWKAEWVAFPELAHYACTATGLAARLVASLEVDPAAMLANLRAAGFTSSERLLSLMSQRLGKHSAQAILHDAYSEARRTGTPLAALLDGVATADELAAGAELDLGSSGAMVDHVVSAARMRRAAEGPEWR